MCWREALKATVFYTVFLLACTTASSKESMNSGSSWEQLINLWIFVFVIMVMNGFGNCSSVFLDFKVATVWAISWNNLPFPLECTEAVGPWVWSKWLCVLSIWQEWWMELQVQGNRGLIGMTSASLPGQTWHTRDQWIMVEEEFDRLESITFFFWSIWFWAEKLDPNKSSRFFY